MSFIICVYSQIWTDPGQGEGPAHLTPPSKEKEEEEEEEGDGGGQGVLSGGHHPLAPVLCVCVRMY